MIRACEFLWLKESLRKLQTDHVDLIQVHAVNALADLEQALPPDGAVVALEEARRQGLVRVIGITGHARPEVPAHALTQYCFDTVLVALGMADRLVTSPETFLLPKAVERNVERDANESKKRGIRSGPGRSRSS